MTETSKRGFRTRLSHTGRAGKRVHGFVNPPLLRGSTVLYPTVAERRALAARRGERRADLRARRVRNPLGAGGHDRRGGRRHALRDRVLGTGGGDDAAAGVSQDGRSLPDAGFSVYGPARNFAEGFLKRFGVETGFYDPVIDEAGMADSDAAEHDGGLYRESGQPHFRGAGYPRHRPRGACARREGADGQHLGHPSLPAVQTRRRCIDPGGDEISRGAFRHPDRQHHGELRCGLADGCTRHRADLVSTPARTIAG